MNTGIKTENAFDFMMLKKVAKYLYGTNGYIAGGVFKNIFKQEPIKDVDLFFRDKKDFHKDKSKFEDDDNYKHIYNSKNAIGFYDKKEDIRVDLVKSRFLDPIKMIKSFDFTITKFVLYSELEKMMGGRSMEHTSFLS